MPDTEDPHFVEVAEGLQDLAIPELIQLFKDVNCQDGEARKRCEASPWFPKVERWFTENEGQAVNNSTREAIGRVLNLRLVNTPR